MTNIFDFEALFQETSETIRARMDADANAGLEVTDPQYVNLREGSFYFDVTQVVLLEMARLWDALSLEVPAAAFPLYAWGSYLDDHAATFGLERKEALSATGVVTFTGDPATVVAQGSVVSSDATSDEGQTLEYQTTEEVVLGAQVPAPGTVTPTIAATGGALVTDTYYYYVTAYNDFGETLSAPEVVAAVAGPAGAVSLDWADVSGSVGYYVYRGTESGSGIRVYDGAASTFNDTGAVIAGEAGPPALNSTAGVQAAIEALDTGSDYNVGPLAVVNQETVNVGVDAVRNDDVITGGTEAESDEALRERILIEFEGAGSGNVNDYRRWALSIPGVGQVHVVPVFDGPGTVLVVVADAAGNPVSGAIIANVQAFLDPVPGQAEGQAPPGISVTVDTPTIVTIDVIGTVVFDSGFDLDGLSGNIALRDTIEASLATYIDHLDVGEDVIYDHVKAQFFAVDGVFNVSGVQVNGGTANITIASTEASALGTATLS